MKFKRIAMILFPFLPFIGLANEQGTTSLPFSVNSATSTVVQCVEFPDDMRLSFSKYLGEKTIPSIKREILSHINNTSSVLRKTEIQNTIEDLIRSQCYLVNTGFYKTYNIGNYICNKQKNLNTYICPKDPKYRNPIMRRTLIEKFAIGYCVSKHIQPNRPNITKQHLLKFSLCLDMAYKKYESIILCPPAGVKCPNNNATFKVDCGENNSSQKQSGVFNTIFNQIANVINTIKLANNNQATTQNTSPIVFSDENILKLATCNQDQPPKSSTQEKKDTPKTPVANGQTNPNKKPSDATDEGSASVRIPETPTAYTGGGAGIQAQQDWDKLAQQVGASQDTQQSSKQDPNSPSSILERLGITRTTQVPSAPNAAGGTTVSQPTSEAYSQLKEAGIIKEQPAQTQTNPSGNTESRPNIDTTNPRFSLSKLFGKDDDLKYSANDNKSASNNSYTQTNRNQTGYNNPSSFLSPLLDFFNKQDQKQTLEQELMQTYGKYAVLQAKKDNTFDEIL